VNANTSTQHQSELGAGQAQSVNPDFIYPKSYDLTKDNALILYDKENRVIDKVCWGNPKDFQNCISNLTQSAESALSPNQSAISLQRKKTATSTSETIISQNLGNAYSTNNSSNDFLYAPISPENSNTIKPTIKEIIEGHFFQNSDNKIILHWFSPAFYDNDLSYYLEVATKTDIFDNNTTTFNFIPLNQVVTFTLPNFSLLSNQQIDIYIDLTKLGLEQNSNVNLLIFKLYLRKNESIILDEKLIGGIELM
jgi:hypothetical protein